MIERATREFVFERANRSCEYCRMPAAAYPGRSLHVEHVRARQHGGGDGTHNLALACDRCNLHKGTNLTSVDSQSGNVALLFNPRLQNWDSHFRLATTGAVVGLTDVGRATAQLLGMKRPERVVMRFRWVVMRRTDP